MRSGPVGKYGMSTNIILFSTVKIYWFGLCEWCVESTFIGVGVIVNICGKDVHIRHELWLAI